MHTLRGPVPADAQPRQELRTADRQAADATTTAGQAIDAGRQSVAPKGPGSSDILDAEQLSVDQQDEKRVGDAREAKGSSDSHLQHSTPPSQVTQDAAAICERELGQGDVEGSLNRSEEATQPPVPHSANPADPAATLQNEVPNIPADFKTVEKQVRSKRIWCC